MGPKYWLFGNGRPRPLVLSALAAALVAALIGAWVITEVWRGGGNEDPNPNVPLADQITGENLLMYLVPSTNGTHALSPVNPGLAAPALAKAPLIFDTPERSFRDLIKYVWTDASITFSGTGFSGTWLHDDKARLVIQLNGPINNPHYSSCLAMRINGQDESQVCSSGFSEAEFVPGGYTAVINIPPPRLLELTDEVEISFILGTSSIEGKEPVPNLVFGGNTPAKTSFLEIVNNLE